MTKHTPGPWIHDQPENMIVARQPNGNEWLVAQARSIHYPIDVRDANARLIAAAPDLLAALERCAIKLDRYREQHGEAYIGGVAEGYDAVSTIAHAAIAKATQP